MQKIILIVSFLIEQMFVCCLMSQTQHEINSSQKSSLMYDIKYIKELLEQAKSDSTCLKKLTLEPSEFGYQLNSAAWESFNKGEFSSAIDFFEMEISLLDALGETGSDDYLSIIPCEVLCYIELDNFERAISLADYNLSLIKTHKEENTDSYAHGLQTKAGVYYNFGKGSEAIALYEESLSLFDKCFGKYNKDYINCLRKTASAYGHILGNLTKQIELESEAEKLLERTISATFADKASNFNALSHCHAIAGNKEMSLEYAEKAVNELETSGVTDNYECATYLSTLCSALTDNNDYTKAIEIGQKAVDVFAKLELSALQKIAYRQTVSTLSFSYFESGNVEKAISTIESILSNDVPSDEQKISDLQRLATYYQRLGIKERMAETIENSLAMAETLGGKHSDIYANALLFAAFIQEKKGDAILMLQQAADIFSDLHGVDSGSYIKTQQALALLSNTESKTENQQHILETYKAQYGENNTRYFNQYVNYLSTIGEQYQQKKDIDNLIKTVIELDSLSQIIYSTFSRKEECYILARHNLAELLIDCFNLTYDNQFYNSGVEIQKDVVSTALSQYGENNVKYIREVECLARIMSHISTGYYYIHKEEFDKIFELNSPIENSSSESWNFYKSTDISKCFEYVRELQRRVVDFHKSINNGNNSGYAYACKKLADYYSKEIDSYPNKDMLFLLANPNDIVYAEMNARKKTAERLYNSALDYYKDNLDFDSASDILQDLNFLYEATNEKTKSAITLSESFRLWKNETLKQLSLMTSDEKSQMAFDSYWQSRIDHYNTTAYYKSKAASFDSRYAELSYDVQLLSKGLLLKSGIGLRDLIMESGDSILIKNYTKLSILQDSISKTDDEFRAKALKKEYQLLERQLMKDSEMFGNYMNDFSYSFNDVKSRLGDNDVAIEFATMRFPSKDDNGAFMWDRVYFALVLKHNYSSPKIVHLKDNISLDSIFQTIWEPLIDEIKGMKNVYFSPTYDLSCMPLESAVLPDGTFLYDLGINFYRVSSTREIIKRQKDNITGSMALYGGLQYNADLEDMIDKEESISSLRGVSPIDENVKSDLRKGAQIWKYLPGTRKEISDIESIASDNGIQTTMYFSTKGTESSFKKLSGKDINIIHVATHGFYIQNSNNKSEEAQLKRSGLAFVGANNIARGITLPANVDDGILTAAEISTLDLRSVSMVVLSACETGLGAITGEGVYGLQRGFKKAGVNSIMMSLWPVDDTATQMLMVEFYKHYLQGATKTDALRHAQQSVKSQQGFEDPEYWAGFILLDALN